MRRLALIALAVATRTAAAQRPIPTPEPGSELTISLLTMGAGKEEVWELFGHNALWIHDGRLGSDAVVNWGMFNFQQPHFIARFLKGDMLYTMGATTMDTTLLEYRYLNRKVWAQELDLTPAQRLSIREYVAWNMRPENREYRYDYYRNNCSTRIRDIIDRVLGGQINAAATRTLTGTTLRFHTLRVTQSDPPLAVGIDIGLGEPGDRAITAWQEMFLPFKLHDFLSGLQVRDPDGRVHPLVKSDRVLIEGQEPADGPPLPPPMALWLTPVGILVAAVFFGLLVFASGGSKAARISASILLATWSFAVGFLGVILTLMWTVTNHVFSHHNENLLLFHPLWLALVVLLPMSVGFGRARRATRAVAMTTAALACIALLIHVVPLSSQVNLPLVGLVLPSALVIAWAARGYPRAEPRQ